MTLQLLNDANVKIKLRLVYVELWNQDDLFEVSRNAREALTAFLRYRKETLTHVQFDYAHFMRSVF
jgi:Reprolysin (M12B) family zinc metalloprotease